MNGYEITLLDFDSPTTLALSIRDVDTGDSRTKALSPETALRVRKYAADNGMTTLEAMADLLSKTECVGNLFFVPSR